jgi:hypothetical protein
MVVPKAGMITMSSAVSSSQSISMWPWVSWMKRSPRLFEVLIHLGVVDHLAEQEDALAGVVSPGLCS